MANIANPELMKVVVLLITGITVVPLFKRLGLGSVLGYLVAGCLIGPSVLGMFDDPQAVVHLAELGVVMFLFIIGLEMHPERLWSMRKAIFGRGLLQVASAGALLTSAGIFILGFSPEVSFIAGMGFALSSTAIVMQVLEERGVSNTPKGQRIVSTLLFEDLAIVPLLASIAFLAPNGGAELSEEESLMSVGAALVGIIILITLGKWVMNPIFRMISKAHIREMMTAAALLVVLGAALLMELSGLSMAMGAFVAGVLLSESSFRHQLEADIEPFRGLLLGLFFMGVGMSLDLVLVWDNLLFLLGIVLLYICGKALAIFLVAKITLLDNKEAVSRTAIMAHGGEFAFVLFAAAASANVLDAKQQAILTAAVIISMLFSPLILIALRKLSARKVENQTTDMDGIDLIEDLEDSVVVVGFGRFSQIVCQALLAKGTAVTVIDSNTNRIRAAAKFGFKVYYGDGSRIDVLRAAGLEKARCVILGIGTPAITEQIVVQLKEEYPMLPILARTYDRRSAVGLIKHNIDYQVRETYESALALSHAALVKLGSDEVEASDIITYVRHLDQDRIKEEVLHGLSDERIREYWTPKPLIRPHQTPAALNEAAADLLEDIPHIQETVESEQDTVQTAEQADGNPAKNAENA